MSVSFKEDIGNRRVYVHIDNLPSRTKRSIRQGFFELGKDLKQTANKEILRKPKGGRTYIVRGPSGRRRRHVASAPGETHANLTGKLRRSLGWQVHGAHSMEFGYGVGGAGAGLKPAPEYAEYVEFGTRKMAARPSLANAIRAVDRNAEKHFEQAFRKFTK